MCGQCISTLCFRHRPTCHTTRSACSAGGWLAAARVIIRATVPLIKICIFCIMRTTSIKHVPLSMNQQLYRSFPHSENEMHQLSVWAVRRKIFNVIGDWSVVWLYSSWPTGVWDRLVPVGEWEVGEIPQTNSSNARNTVCQCTKHSDAIEKRAGNDRSAGGRICTRMSGGSSESRPRVLCEC